MRLYPHRGFSVAIPTTRPRIPGSAWGRPGRRFEYVHFRATSCRYHRRNGVGCHDRRHVRQQPTTQARAEDGQPSPVMVRSPQTLMPQLRLQDAVLFAQVLDDVVLFPLEPAEE